MENTAQYSLIIKQVCCIKAQRTYFLPSLWLPNSPDLNPVDCVVWGIRQAHLEEPVQGREKAAPAHQGGVGQSWSASGRQCYQGKAQETAILHCSWWGTFQTCIVICERDWFASCFNAAHLLVNLSLIHIWRCRRIERCRSRWSPYH